MLILVLEDKGPSGFKRNFLQYVHDRCNPTMDYYDDDEGIDGVGRVGGGHVVALGKITHQTNVRCYVHIMTAYIHIP